MKRIIFLTLLLIILLQSCGLMLYYQLKQNDVHSRMQEILANPESKFEKLVLSLNNYNKSRIGKHEIYINGIMYDVKSLKYSGDFVLLSVLVDDVESKIINKIKDYFGINSKHNSKIPEQLNKFFTLVYILPSINFTVLSNCQTQNLFYSFSENFLSSKPGILTPPPRSI